MAANPFVAEIVVYPYNFPPKGWAFCDGQLLSISQNTALFSLIGTYYGGNGISNFALPNLQGAAVLAPGDSTADGTYYSLGQVSGTESVTLLPSEMPSHKHAVMARTDTGEDRTPGNEVFAKAVGGKWYGPATGATQVQMAAETAAPAGGNFAHNNMMPYLTLNYCIALQGVFPQRQ